METGRYVECVLEVEVMRFVVKLDKKMKKGI